jgi:hypothetical protein
MKREPSPYVYISKELQDLLTGLPPEHKFVRWIQDMSDVLKENKFAGDLVEKSKIPKFYEDLYQVNNLYHYTHPEGFRSCYTIVLKCPVILDLRDHNEYSKIFGYRT